MSRIRAVALIVLGLAAFALLAAPAAAHTVSAIAAAPDAPAADVAVAPGPEEIRSRESSGLPAWTLAGGLLLAVATGRRSSRRVLVLGLILLLALFAFENALHSVHHGLDAKQSDECTIAAASAHLSAVSVDHLVATPVILTVAERPGSPDLTRPSSRPRAPDQGRAPPTPTA